MKKFLSILLIALVACAHVEETTSEMAEFDDEPHLQFFLDFLNPVFKAIDAFFINKLSFGKIAHLEKRLCLLIKKHSMELKFLI